MKNLSHAVIINGVSYTITVAEAKKVADLLGINKDTTVATDTSSPAPSEPKKAKGTKSEPKTKKVEKVTRTVGSLEQDGVFVRTVKGAFISSKARYAIKMTATDMGATKLGKGNNIYDALAKDDQYVQVYQFETVDAATKFMDAQEARLAK